MKHNWKALLISAVLGTAALLGVACGTSPELEPFQGHWVDINSDAALDFSGNTMTLNSYGTEVYTVKVGDGQVVNAKNQRDQFGIMGNLYIENDGSLTAYENDGSLTAYEQILDADGHRYRFVREEDKAQALEIQDYSTDLPKNIQSTSIETFRLNFRKQSDQTYGLDQNWPSGRYCWLIERQEDGSYTMEFDCFGGSYVAMEYESTVDAAYVEGLAQLIQELKLPQLNGYSMRNEVDRDGYSLSVDYESGEQLRISAKGDAATTCVFDLPALLDHAQKQPIRQF